MGSLDTAAPASILSMWCSWAAADRESSHTALRRNMGLGHGCGCACCDIAVIAAAIRDGESFSKRRRQRRAGPKLAGFPYACG